MCDIVLIICILLILFIIVHLFITRNRLLKHPMRTALCILVAIILVYFVIGMIILSQQFVSWLGTNINTLTICVSFVLSIDILWAYFQRTLNTFRSHYKKFYINKRKMGIPVKKFHVRGLSLIGQSGLPYVSLLLVIIPSFIKFTNKIPNGKYSLIIFLVTIGIYESLIGSLIVITHFLERAQLHLEKKRLYNDAILKKILMYMLSENK